MKRNNPFKKEFSLTGDAIDDFSLALDEELSNSGIEKQNRIRIKLSVEEALLRYRDRFGEDAIVEIEIRNRFGHNILTIGLVGDIYNPLAKGEDEGLDWSGGLLTSVGMNLQYSYTSGENILRLALPPERMNPAIKVMIMIAIGFAVGMLLTGLISNEMTKLLCTNLLEPLFDMWNRVLVTMSSPVIFFMVMATLLNTGAIAEQGGHGRRVILRYFVFSMLASLVSMIGSDIVLSGETDGAIFGLAELSDAFQSIFKIVPETIVSPFISVNTPQILLLAIVIGNAIMVAGDRANELKTIAKQLNGIGLLVVEWISRLVPYISMVLIVLEILQHRTGLLIGSWKPLVLSLVITVVYLIICILYVCRRNRVKPILIVRKLMPPFVEAVKAGNLDASYGLVEQSSIHELGINSAYTKASLASGLVLYMPINVIGTLAFTVYAAAEYHVSESLVWVVTAMILSVILFTATPPVPGANLLAYIAIFAQLGIPSVALVDAMIFDILFGTIASAANQTMLQIDLTLQADKLGLLDHDILSKGVGSR